MLANAPSHRLGLESTLAILEPRWCPCQIQVLSQELTGGAPGRGRKVGRCPQICAVLGQKQPFFAQSSPQNPGETPKTRETVATLHVRLDLTVSKSPLVPFNSTMCPRNGPKRCQKAPKSAQRAPTPCNQARAVSWATWLQPEFPGHLVHLKPPSFGGFQASQSPNDPPRPPYR